MSDIKVRGFVLSRRVTFIAHLIFILCMLGIVVYSFVFPHFGLSWGWIVIVIAPIWAFLMANIGAA
jgi:hypothetical protein